MQTTRHVEPSERCDAGALTGEVRGPGHRSAKCCVCSVFPRLVRSEQRRFREVHTDRF